MLKIGLTGGIGSGKSEVSKFFQAWGAYIFDADKEAKHIINTDESAQKEIIKEFGSDVIDADQNIDNQKLARVAFQDEFHQLALNSIIHPHVFKKIDSAFEKIQQQNFEIGYNAINNKFENMYEKGIVDPAKVTRSALQNATSIASMILTTECIIVDENKNLNE